MTQVQVLRSKIREKRHSPQLLWRKLFLLKDSIWKLAKPLRLNPHLILNSRLIKKVQARKLSRKQAGFSYTDKPNLSLIILSFNHRKNIKPIIERLRLTQADEIIVCEDGSLDGSHEEWMKSLTRPNDFLIHSNDLHEMRAYDRAIHLARGPIVCVGEDDDIPPENGEWVTGPLQLFQLYPKLAILGGYRGWLWRSKLGGFVEKDKYGYRRKAIPFLEPQLNLPFCFVDAVSLGPIFYRKEAYIQLGGFDLNYAKPGETGIVFEHEICVRAWLNGWHVGLYDSGAFKRGVGGQGTYLFGRAQREANHRRNRELLRTTYGSLIGSLERVPSRLNETVLKRRTTPANGRKDQANPLHRGWPLFRGKA